MKSTGAYNRDLYKYCAGYQYSDPTIVGFSHTHFSGTGHSDLGDILLMPTTGVLQLNPGTADMVNSMLAHYDQSIHKMLPVWSHHANENWCMIGYHAVPVTADAIVKGIG
jgi:putative alpha-1,2-mannosidase